MIQSPENPGLFLCPHMAFHINFSDNIPILKKPRCWGNASGHQFADSYKVVKFMKLQQSTVVAVFYAPCAHIESSSAAMYACESVELTRKISCVLVVHVSSCHNSGSEDAQLFSRVCLTHAYHFLFCYGRTFLLDAQIFFEYLKKELGITLWVSEIYHF